MFKPGQLVQFTGVTVGRVVCKPVRGVLFQNDKRTNRPGVMSIKNDRQRMMFNPDGTIYCHENLGVALVPVEEVQFKDVDAQKLIEELNSSNEEESNNE